MDEWVDDERAYLEDGASTDADNVAPLDDSSDNDDEGQPQHGDRSDSDSDDDALAVNASSGPWPGSLTLRSAAGPPPRLPLE